VTEVLAELSQVDFSYGQLQVLFGVDLQIRTGEVLGLLGTNGAGKSTSCACCPACPRPRAAG
jgi:ABC-type sugar transport system ATPase subunit